MNTKQQELNDKIRPPCTVTIINEPNFELMAEAFINLYYSLKKNHRQGNNL